MPNGEATDMEMPGKSSSEDELQGAAFSGGETLMGTLSDSAYFRVPTPYGNVWNLILVSSRCGQVWKKYLLVSVL